ncbi:hypothetical protein [Fodinicola feengrottensis]|uniref:hypothetical protein n=1 Tax=Fodinicola feengrottensis TaxID=435914 RepID=UPI0013D8642C|nr:hypothetical protein [Fodinicola feengrottensis]
MRRRSLPLIAAALLVAGLLIATPAQAATGPALSASTLSAMTLTDNGSFPVVTGQRNAVEAAGAPLTVVRLNTIIAGGYDTRAICHPTDLRVTASVAGFCWTTTDDSTTTWYPQGITGSGDGVNGSVLYPPCDGCAGRKIVAVSWHGTNDALARVTFVDVANGTYRHVLLVEPDSASTRFHAVESHADGIMWYGNKLFLVSGGTRVVRVFDLTHFWQMRAPRPARSVVPRRSARRRIPASRCRKSATTSSRTRRAANRCVPTIPPRPPIPASPASRSTGPPSPTRWSPANTTTRVHRAASCAGPWTPAQHSSNPERTGSYAPVKAGLRPSSVCREPFSPAATALSQACAPTASHQSATCRPAPTTRPSTTVSPRPAYIRRLSPRRDPLDVHYWTTAPLNSENVSYWPSSGELWLLNEFRGSTDTYVNPPKAYPGDRLVLALHCPALICS